MNQGCSSTKPELVTVKAVDRLTETALVSFVLLLLSLNELESLYGSTVLVW